MSGTETSARTGGVKVWLADVGAVGDLGAGMLTTGMVRTDPRELTPAPLNDPLDWVGILAFEPKTRFHGMSWALIRCVVFRGSPVRPARLATTAISSDGSTGFETWIW